MLCTNLWLPDRFALSCITVDSHLWSHWHTHCTWSSLRMLPVMMFLWLNDTSGVTGQKYDNILKGHTCVCLRIDVLWTYTLPLNCDQSPRCLIVVSELRTCAWVGVFLAWNFSPIHSHNLLFVMNHHQALGCSVFVRLNVWFSPLRTRRDPPQRPAWRRS